MRIFEEISKIDWGKYETAYGNAASDNENYNVEENLKQLFSGNEEMAIKATHHLWCGLCNQRAFVSSAALPAYDFLLYGLKNLNDELKIEILDILLGFATCISADNPPGSWQGRLREKLAGDQVYFQVLSSNENEDIASFSENIVEALRESPGDSK